MWRRSRRRLGHELRHRHWFRWVIGSCDRLALLDFQRGGFDKNYVMITASDHVKRSGLLPLAEGWPVYVSKDNPGCVW